MKLGLKRLPARKLVVVGLAAGATLGIASAVQASIPDGQGVIHGCYDNTNGNLRVIDPGSSKCRTNETGVDWNQTGPTGPTGATGTQGPKGDPGATGATGPSDAWSAERSGDGTGNGIDAFEGASVTVPAGHYTLSASGIIDYTDLTDFGTQLFECDLFTSNPSTPVVGDPSTVALNGNGLRVESWALDAVVTAPYSETVSVGCSSQLSFVPYYVRSTLVVTKVGTLH